MQLKQAVNSAYQRFVADEVPSPRLNAEILMTFTLGRDRSFLFAHPERELTAEEQVRYEEVVTQRDKAVPHSTLRAIRSSGVWICWSPRQC